MKRLITGVLLSLLIVTQAAAFGFGNGWLGFGDNGYQWRPQTLTSSLPATMTFTRASAVTVPDNLGALQTVSTNVPTFEGMRLSYNLAEGATLGPELIVNGDFTIGTGWTLNAGWTIGDGAYLTYQQPVFRGK